MLLAALCFLSFHTQNKFYSSTARALSLSHSTHMNECGQRSDTERTESNGGYAPGELNSSPSPQPPTTKVGDGWRWRQTPPNIPECGLSIHPSLVFFCFVFCYFLFLCFIYIYKQYSSCLMQIRILTQSPSPPANLLLKVRLNCDTLSIGTGWELDWKGGRSQG